MDYELAGHSFCHPHLYQLHEYSSENKFPFQTEYDLLSPNTSQDAMLDQEFIEGLLQQPHAELLDLDFMDPNISIEIETESSQKVSTPRSQEIRDPCLMGIQAALMEDCSIVDLLLTGAEAVEAQNWVLALEIIKKINNDLCVENEDGLLNRLAIFFTQGLYYKTISSHAVNSETFPTHTNTFFPFQIIQEISPYVKFAHFTANQAMFEATEGDEEIHVIDFDIMDGIQWPPLMVDLSTRKNTTLRVTAITLYHQSVASVTQTGRRLQEFAASINFSFTFDQIMIAGEEDFRRITLGPTLIVNCMIHQWMPKRSFSLIKTFLDGVSKLSPKLVVLVEDELFNISRLKSMSFVEFFYEALHHNIAICDSLASSLWDKCKIKLIEKDVVGNRIIESVRHFPCEREERTLWEEGLNFLKGFKRVHVSKCNISQAKFLVSLFGGEYWVQHVKGRFSLCWKSRPLATTSIWVPTRG